MTRIRYGATKAALRSTLAGAALGLLCASGAHAALVDRGGGLIYDTVQDITWLADLNHAQTQYNQSGGAVGNATGQMNWLAANLWASDLVYGGYTDWRLPTVMQPDTACSDTFDPGGAQPLQYYGYGCTGSEMGHLFYSDLGGHANESLLDATGDSAGEIANLALFTNVQNGLYWTSSHYGPNALHAWTFFTFDGAQGVYNKGFELSALAVRRGDSVGTVAEPSAAALVLLALGLMSGQMCGLRPRG